MNNSEIQNLIKNSSTFESNELLKSLIPSTSDLEKKIELEELPSLQKNMTNELDMDKTDSNLNTIQEIKNEMIKNRKEMEKIRNELKVYKDSLLLKKELSLYKQALENSERARVDS
jgi:uncharacterized protein YpuA (DUF1002 family)